MRNNDEHTSEPQPKAMKADGVTFFVLTLNSSNETHAGESFRETERSSLLKKERQRGLPTCVRLHATLQEGEKTDD